jgi:hypothetical protein
MAADERVKNGYTVSGSAKDQPFASGNFSLWPYLRYRGNIKSIRGKKKKFVLVDLFPGRFEVFIVEKLGYGI